MTHISGTFQEAGVIQESYNLNHPLTVINSAYSGKVYVDMVFWWYKVRMYILL